MFQKRFRLVAGACLALATGLVLQGHAEDNSPGDGVPRVFGVFVKLDDRPDWEGPESIALVAHPASDSASTLVYFRTAGNPDWLADTQWLSAATTHVKTGGADQRSYYWLQPENAPRELPPNGATASTGPNGDVVVLGRYWVKNADDTAEFPCAGLNDCGWQVIGEDDGQSPPTPGADALFYIGCGMFSK